MRGLVISQRLRFVIVGTLVGASCSAWIWHGEQAAIAAGQNVAGAGFGVATLLFLLCLPWSLAVWALMIGTALLTGADGAVFIRPFFYAMPIVAGAGWAWAAYFVVRWFERRTA
jgi:hypothetical protein